MKPTLTIFSSFLICSSVMASAPEILIKGTELHSIHPIKQHRTASMQPRMDPLSPKKIPLLSVELSKQAWNQVKSHLTLSQKSSFIPKSTPIQTQNQLGMNGLPVLDQGPYGSCATFAVTAAINAVFSPEDSISQLCQLEFGQYLSRASHEKALSGWEGLSTNYLLHQLSVFGFITKEAQARGYCGPLLHYPDTGEIPSDELSIEQFSQISTPLYEKAIHWTPIVDFIEIMSNEVSGQQVLNKVKQSIDEGDRLILSVLIITPEMGLAGALGQHGETTDTWILTPEMLMEVIKNPSQIAAHALIITGYDDYATAVDPEGHLHQGLLTVRNSWGDHVGNHGDFYISYAYFKALVTSVERVRDLNPL